MSTTIPIGSQTAPVGVTVIGPFSVPVNDSHFLLSLDAVAFNLLSPSSVITWKTELSQDNGVTWGSEASGTRAGNSGPLPVTADSDGSKFIIATDLFNPTNPNRKMKLTLTVAGPVSVTTSGGSLVLS